MMGEQDANVLRYLTDLQVRLRSEGGPGQWPSLPKREGPYPGKMFCLGTHVSWQVEDVRHRPDCWRIMLFFASNPYFRDTLVVKEYVTNGSGKRRLRLWRQQAWGAGPKSEQEPSAPSHRLFPQDTWRLGPRQCSGTGVVNARPAAAGSATAA